MIAKAQSIADEIIRLRRDIHQHPELGFREFRTAALVADTLQEIGGYSIKTQVGRTGVVAEIGSGTGPTIAIRADMDALPIHETIKLPYQSQTPGIMHACGHDAHTAMLLGVAQLLKQSFATDKWNGNVRLIFQPSEEMMDENGISGATAMISDGALDGVDSVIALHIISNLEAGKCFFQDGFSMAAVDEFKGWITASGGHGAYPHLATDPIAMLPSVLNYLYAIPSRRISPLHSSVVSLGQIHAGTTSNVIPNNVYLHGTIRSYDPEVRIQLWQEVENGFKVAKAIGGDYKFELYKGYPAMFNNHAVNHWLRQSASDLLGPTAVEEAQFGMGAEDFAYMTQKLPGAMFFLGAATPDGVARNHHTDIFSISEAVLPNGTAVLAETARRFVTGLVTLP